MAKPTAGGAPRHSSVLLSPKSAKIAELNACVDNLQAELNAEKDEKEQLQAEVDSYKARFTDDIEQELQEEVTKQDARLRQKDILDAQMAKFVTKHRVYDKQWSELFAQGIPEIFRLARVALRLDRANNKPKRKRESHLEPSQWVYRR